jgi:hypothetical protein
MFLLISFNLKSQEVSKDVRIESFSEMLSKAGKSDLQSLYYDNQPSLLLKAEKTILTSEKSAPKVLEVNVSNLHLLNDKNFNLSSIELIRVIYNQADATSMLDLSKIRALKALKAIVFQCDFNCSSKEIEALIKSTTKIDASIYYLISIPE